MVARDSRFGGEGGGFTVVVNFASFLCAQAHRSKWQHTPTSYYKDCQPPPGSGKLHKSTYGSVSGVIVLDSCMIASDGDQTVSPARSANIYLEAIPSQLIVRNCWGFAFRPTFVASHDSNGMAVVRVNSSIDLDGPQLDYAAQHPGLLRFDIGKENSFVPSGGDNVTDPGLPLQLLPYAAGQIMSDGSPTRGVWRQNDLIWNRASGSEVGFTVPTIDTALGWQCVKSGKPGEWRPIEATRGPMSDSALGDGRNSTAYNHEYAGMMVESLERLTRLHHDGDLTDAEYSAAKVAAIGGDLGSS